MNMNMNTRNTIQVEVSVFCTGSLLVWYSSIGEGGLLLSVEVGHISCSYFVFQLSSNG